MNEKLKEVTQDVGVKDCENTAKETTTIDESFEWDGNDEENPCTYMGVITLDYFVAELFVEYIMGEKKSNCSDECTRSLENAMWELKNVLGVDAEVDTIKNLVAQELLETLSDTDSLLLRLIGYNRYRHSMIYYKNKV